MGDITNLIYEFNQAATADSVNRARGQRNLIALQGVQGNLHSEELKLLSRKTGIPLSSFNLLQKHVKGIGGSFIENWFDPTFETNTILKEEQINVLEKLKEVYLSNKEQNRYKASSARCIMNGLAYRGVEEISIKRENIMDPQTWSIDFEARRPDSIIFDPAVDEELISRKANKAWRYTYPTINELIEIYPDKAPEIKEKLSLQDTNQYDSTEPRDSTYNAFTRRRNGRYQVIEYYEVKNEIVNRWVHKPSFTYLDLPSDMPKEQVVIYAQCCFNQNVTSSDIMQVRDTEKVLHVSVFIPDLNIILDEGLDERQIGRLPFYAWSYLEVCGTSIGLVDWLWDSQVDITKREKAKTRWLEKTPQGKPWIHPDVADGNAKQVQKIVNEWSDPSKPVVLGKNVTPGTAPGLMGILQGSQIPTAITNDESFKIRMMDDISGYNKALQGQSERSGENATLYTRKVIEAGVQQKIPQVFLLEHEHDKVESWIKLVPTVYGGLHNANRSFKKTGSKENITINEIVGYDDSNNPVMRDDFAKLERTHVVLGKANESEFVKQAKRETDISALNSIRPSNTNGEIIAVVENNLVMNMDFSSIEEKNNAQAAADRRLKLEKLNTEAQIINLENKIAAGRLEGTKLDTQEQLSDQLADVAKTEVLVQKANAELQAKEAFDTLEQANNPEPPVQEAQPQAPMQGNIPPEVAMIMAQETSPGSLMETPMPAEPAIPVDVGTVSV